MEYENKNWIWAIVIIALVIGFFGGQWYGKRTEMRNEAQTIKDLKDSLNIFVPPLPDVVNVISGKIIAINDNAFVFEIPSLTDRYPKPGLPTKTETRTVKVTGDAKINKTNFDTKTFKNGLPQPTTIKFSDLKTGDFVTVTVSENARAEQNLTAVSINKTGGM